MRLPRARPSWGWWPVALVLAALLPTARSLQYQHDELLWTKQNWDDYKLDFPWSTALKPPDAERTRQLQGPLEGYAINTLNGPLMDAEEVAQRVEEHARRGSDLRQSSLDVSLLDDEASLDAAAGVAQCKVCGVLARQTWEGLAHWVTLQRRVPDSQHITAYAEQLCEYEVPNEVLKGWVLLRARVQQAPGLPFALDGQAHEFYMLSKRSKQHATPPEIRAVRNACLKLLQDGEQGKEQAQLVHQASSLLHKYLQLVQQRFHPDGASGATEAPEAVGDGPEAQRACYDRHPQCELWRDKGECEGNPKYMLGDRGANNGWCRAACGDCRPEEPAPLGLSTDDAEYIAGASKDLLAVLQSRACVAAAPCRWAAGEGMQQLLAAAKLGADGGAAELMDSAEFIGGPVLSMQQQLEASIDQTRLKESRPMLVRELGEALVREKGSPSAAAGGSQAVPAPEHFRTEAGAALWQELGGKCLYVTTGWWTYEICYMHHLTQFHMDEKHTIDWVISLGSYEVGSANWTLATASLTGLYPHFTKVPYASQHYNSGNHCDLDPEPGSDKQQAVLRSSELRVMCSPDGDPHIIVSEPQQCAYLVELYMPSLCALPGWQVALPEGPGAHLGFATRRRGGGPTAALVGGLTSGEDEGLDAKYVLPETEADEYADPDETATGDSEGGEGSEGAARRDEL